MLRYERARMGLLIIIALVAAACGGSGADEVTGDGGSGESLSGTVEIDGSSTVGPLTDAIAEEYNEVQPNVGVTVNISGTGGGFERFCAGETDINDASRPIEDEEKQACEEAGVEYTEVRVGTDALTVVTNPQTGFVDCLTFEELAKIWGAQDPAQTWTDVRSDFPDEQIAIFAPDTDSGTYDFFTEEVLGDPEEGAEEVIGNYQANADDNIIAQGIISTPASWGYFGYAYCQENTDSLKALAVDSGDSGCVKPSVETAESGEYPLARPLFIYVKNSALEEKPQVKDFVTYYLENVNSLITDVGYIPAPEEAIQESMNDVTGGGSSSGGSEAPSEMSS
ncbi:MAG: PstS family phosphate ABC transporter substrate-binding protein [Egibacteraceae bacterium]